MSNSTHRAIRKVIIQDAAKGLGIQITGGMKKANSVQNYGVFVKKILPGAAATQGILEVGDQLIEVNGASVKGASNSRVVEILRKAAASDLVELMITSDARSRLEFSEIMSRKEQKNKDSRKTGCLMNGTNLQNGVPVTSEHVLKKICIMKTRNGIGLRVKVCNIHDFDEGIQVLEVDEILPSGAVFEDGRLEPGDKIIKCNGQLVVGWTPAQLHSVFLREKLRIELSIDFEYIPHGTPQKTIVSVLHHHLQNNQDSTHHNHETRMSNGSHEEMKNLTNLTEMPPMPVIDTNLSVSKSPTRRSPARPRKLTLDENSRIEMRKLEAALSYLGVHPICSGDLEELNEMLRKDENGTVRYGDFVDAIKVVFQPQLEDLGLGKGKLHFVAPELLDRVRNQATSPPPCEPEYSKQHEDLEGLETKLSEKKSENAKLHQKVQSMHLKLKNTRGEHEISTKKLQKMERVVDALRREKEKSVSESEKIINTLKADLAKLQHSTNDANTLADVNKELEEMRIRASLIDCEYRKASEVRKIHEDATRQLIGFVSKVISEGNCATEADALTRLSNLGKEADQIVSTLRPSLQSVDVPYGWEEAVLPDGSKYFINHADQSTSWVDPRYVAESDELRIAPLITFDSSAPASANDSFDQVSLERQSLLIPPPPDHAFE